MKPLGIDFTRHRILLLCGVVFVLLNAIAISSEVYVLCTIPFAIVLAWMLLYKVEWSLLGIGLLTPLSVNLENLDALGGIGISLPTEPLIVGLMLLYLLRIITGHREPKAFMRHPLTVLILLHLVWMAVASVFSIMPVVSFKFFLARLWFITVMYLLIHRFIADETFLRKFLVLSISGLTIIIIYTVVRHSMYGFAEKPAHWVMEPFYKDHTSYGAILALFFPLVIFHFSRSRLFSFGKVFWTGVLIIFTIGLILSYTRAAWVSLIGAAGLYAILRLRIDFRLVGIGALIVVGTFFAFQDNLIHQIRKNRQDSSGDLKEHVQSISNVSSDASNLERLNRWNSALRMWSDKPLLGFGPGTYMFQYATYQKSSDKTIISTNQGDGGNAHSEYLGPLSEQGLPGAVLILIIFVGSLVVGIRLYYVLPAGSYVKGAVMCMVLGLTTYYLHGVLNNYLDTDKASVPVWAMMSALVALSLKYRRPALPEPAAE